MFMAMTQLQPHTPQTPPPQPSDDTQQWQLWVTVGLLVAFVVFVTVLIAFADEDPNVWQRRLHVFTGVQAIVFTAVGWLFGREINLSAAKTANTHANRYKSEADAARSESKELRKQLTDAKLAAEQERAKGIAARAAVDGALAALTRSADGHGDVELGARQTNDLTVIKALLDEIFE
jgi:hypothetical protein